MSGLGGGFTGKTATAIRLYQSDWQLPETGKIHDELIARLKREHPDTKPHRLKAENSDCFVNNPLRSARVTFTFFGHCPNGKRSGLGTTIWKYMEQGEMKSAVNVAVYQNGKLNSWGLLFWPNGNRYEGEFNDGLAHGQGVVTWANGSRYEGEWRNDKRHGYGVITWASGNRFEGELRKGKRYGHWVFTWKNGERYEGEYSEGKRHGQGVLTMNNGERYEGEWRGGKPHGAGNIVSADGSVNTGVWNQGCWKEGSTEWALFTTPEACGFK